MSRALTATELGYMQRGGQFSRLFVAFPDTPVIFTCRVNQTFTTHDMVYQVTYDGATGSYDDIEPGSTLLIGSTGGAYDKGIARVRKEATPTVIYVGECSEVDWENDLYLTVLDEFTIWPKHLRIDGTTPYIDYDVAYSNQHTVYNPLVVMGADRVLWYKGTLGGATVITADFDASASSCLSAGAKTYLWTCNDAYAITGGTTATPQIEFNAPGTYRVMCAVTVAGKTSYGHRTVMVYDDTALPHEIELDNCSGDYETGGWSFGFTAYDDVDLGTVRDRQQCILFARDYYQNETEGHDEISIGAVVGSENIVTMGWLSEEETNIEPNIGKVIFIAQGPQFWMEQMQGFPIGIEYGTGTAWTNAPNLTIDVMLFDFLFWRSTLCDVVDVTLPGDTRLASALEAPTGSLWSQIVEVAEASILAHPCTDRYGRFFCEVDSQLLSDANRASIPTVMDVTEAEWIGELSIRRVIVKPVSQLNISGIYYNGSEGFSIFSLANGHIFRRYGGVETLDRLLLGQLQTDANALCGRMIGKKNNEFPEIGFQLAMNNRVIDICPRQYLALAFDEGVRGITFNDNIIPRAISYSHDPRTGFLSVSIDNSEAETHEDLNVNGDIPGILEFPSLPPFPDTYPPLPPLPPYPGGGGSGARALIARFNSEEIWCTFDLESTSPVWSLMAARHTGTTVANTFSMLHVDPYSGMLIRNNKGTIWYGYPGAGFAPGLTAAELVTSLVFDNHPSYPYPGNPNSTAHIYGYGFDGAGGIYVVGGVSFGSSNYLTFAYGSPTSLTKGTHHPGGTSGGILNINRLGVIVSGSGDGSQTTIHWNPSLGGLWGLAAPDPTGAWDPFPENAAGKLYLPTSTGVWWSTSGTAWYQCAGWYGASPGAYGTWGQNMIMTIGPNPYVRSYISTDGGATLAASVGAAPFQMRCFANGGSANKWWGGSSAGIAHTADGGITWQNRTGDLLGKIYDPSHVDVAQLVYL